MEQAFLLFYLQYLAVLLFIYLIEEVLHDLAHAFFRLRGEGEHRSAFVAVCYDLRVDRKAAEERDSVLCRCDDAAAAFEDVVNGAAVRAYETAHVFYKACDLCFCFGTEVDRFANVCESDLLRRRYDNCFAVFNLLYDRKRFIACTRRAVDHEEIKVAPFYAREEFADKTHFNSTAPDDRRVRLIEEAQYRGFRCIGTAEFCRLQQRKASYW